MRTLEETLTLACFVERCPGSLNSRPGQQQRKEIEKEEGIRDEMSKRTALAAATSDVLKSIDGSQAIARLCLQSEQPEFHRPPPGGTANAPHGAAKA
jgi:hypothetical protein